MHAQRYTCRQLRRRIFKQAGYIAIYCYLLKVCKHLHTIFKPLQCSSTYNLFASFCEAIDAFHGPRVCQLSVVHDAPLVCVATVYEQAKVQGTVVSATVVT